MVVHLPNLATSRWAPGLLWAAALGDVEHCKQSSSNHQMHLLVMQPEMNLVERQQHLAQKALGLRLPARSPWCLRTFAFEASTTAGSALFCHKLQLPFAMIMQLLTQLL